MQIHSTRVGEITVEPEYLISFPEGMVGLPEWQQAVVVPIPDVPLLSWLQFTHDPDAAFLILDTLGFFPDYRYTEARYESALEGDLAVFTVVKVPDGDFKLATTNLLAPLVIQNKTTTPRGRQVVIPNSGYSLRHPLFGGDS